MIIAIGLALVTGVCWCAVGTAFSQAADRGLHPALLNLLCFSGIALVTAVLIDWSHIAHTTPMVVVSMAISGLAMTGGMAVLQRAMKRGGHAVAWAVAQAGLAWPFLSAVLIHGERPGILPWIGLLGIVASLALFAQRDRSTETDGTQPWFPLALLGLGLIGIQQSAFQWPSLASPTRSSRRPPPPAVLQRRPDVPAAADALAAGLGPAEERTRWPAIIGFALLGCGASLIAQPAIIASSDHLAAIGLAGIAFPIAIATCIALFSTYSCLHRGERLAARTYAGLGLCLTGVVLMCL